MKFPNLPLNCLSEDSPSRISRQLDNPVYADECTTKMQRISFARVLIKMDVTEPLHKLIKVQDPNGRCFEQQIWYDWVLKYCEKCLLIGHDCNNYKGAQEF